MGFWAALGAPVPVGPLFCVTGHGIFDPAIGIQDIHLLCSAFAHPSVQGSAWVPDYCL